MIDEVESPEHYLTGSVECIEAIESFLGPSGFRSFCLGQVMKYIWRAGKKDDYNTDIRKAQFYLNKSLC